MTFRGAILIYLLVLTPAWAIEVPKTSELKRLQALDNQCMVEHVYKTGPLRLKPTDEQLDAAVQGCVQFHRGVGSWYAKYNGPIDDNAEDSLRTLEKFQRGSRAWLTLALSKCSSTRADSAEACMKGLGGVR